MFAASKHGLIFIFITFPSLVSRGRFQSVSTVTTQSSAVFVHVLVVRFVFRYVLFIVIDVHIYVYCEM